MSPPGLAVDVRAIARSARASARAILEAGEAGDAVGAIVRDAHDHSDWLVEAARQRIPPGPIACRPGCAFCCHLRVVATIPEALRIAAHLRSSLDQDGLEALRNRIETHRRATAGHPDEVRRRVRAACPLLVDGLCSVYPIRPLSCRGWNSTDVLGCEADHEDPSLGVRVPVYLPQYQINAAIREGVDAGIGDAGRESHRVELVAALQVALDSPDAAGRWLAGDRPFEGAEA